MGTRVARLKHTLTDEDKENLIKAESMIYHEWYFLNDGRYEVDDLLSEARLAFFDCLNENIHDWEIIRTRVGMHLKRYQRAFYDENKNTVQFVPRKGTFSYDPNKYSEADKMNLLYSEIDKLPERNKEVCLMLLKNYSHKEVAKKLKISRQRVGKIQQKTIVLLRQVLNKEDFFGDEKMISPSGNMDHGKLKKTPLNKYKNYVIIPNAYRLKNPEGKSQNERVNLEKEK